jgi:hypothetical protein
MTRNLLKQAVSKAWQVINGSDTQSHTEPLVDGWAVRATRIYRHLAYRTAWTPSYSLVAPDGRTPIAGYDNSASFVSYVNRRFATL